jgi:hypothetical protein
MSTIGPSSAGAKAAGGLRAGRREGPALARAEEAAACWV